MTSQQARLIRFALRFPNTWHAYAGRYANTLYSLDGATGIMEVDRINKRFRLRLNREDMTSNSNNSNNMENAQ